jgi:hypothetical protein
MGVAWELHGMCELAFSETPTGRLLEKLDFGSSTKTCPQSPNLVSNRALHTCMKT